MKYPERITGTRDYVGNEAEKLLHIAGVCASTYKSFGYERTILPILERSDIFLQRSGEEIRSRMYIFSDPKGKAEICLRPEMTISVARLFLEKLSSRRLPIRLSYQGEVFRYDNVREGRYRQFLQTGIEFIGSDNRVAADVEAITIALEIMKNIGISDFQLVLGDLELAVEFINSLPISDSIRSRLLTSFSRRKAFDALIDRLSKSRPESAFDGGSENNNLGELLSSMGGRASRSLIREMLSLFVEKEIGPRDLDEIADRFLQRFINDEAMLLPTDCYEAIRKYLSIAGNPDEVLLQLEKLLWELDASPGRAFDAAKRRLEILKNQSVFPLNVKVDLGFRRGIEYYTGFLFEIHCNELGPVSQVCGGGRYDRLLSALGAPKEIPAIGFAMGVERLLLAKEKREAFPGSLTNSSADAVLVSAGRVQEENIWRIAQICRSAGWRVRVEFDQRRLGTVLGYVSDENIPFVIIVGEGELFNQQVRIKNMLNRKEEIIYIKDLRHFIEMTTNINRT